MSSLSETVMWKQRTEALLLGTRLASLSRTLDMAEFHFLDPSGREISLHVQCPWRLRLRDWVPLGSEEATHPAGQRTFDSRGRQFNKLLDERFPGLPVVESVKTEAYGDLTAGCSGGMLIEVFVVSGRNDEAWRAFRRDEHDSHVGYPPDKI